MQTRAHTHTRMRTHKTVLQIQFWICATGEALWKPLHFTIMGFKISRAVAPLRFRLGYNLAKLRPTPAESAMISRQSGKKRTWRTLSHTEGRGRARQISKDFLPRGTNAAIWLNGGNPLLKFLIYIKRIRACVLHSAEGWSRLAVVLLSW